MILNSGIWLWKNSYQRSNSTARLMRVKSLLVGLLLVSAFSTLALLSPANAMGAPPSTCSNRYDDTFTSMVVTSGHMKVDAVSNHLATITASKSTGYDVTFTIHTTRISSQGNTLVGTAWYSTTAPGYAQGACRGAGSSTSITVRVHEAYPSNFNPTGTHVKQSVEWDTWSHGGILFGPTYTIDWV
jgi:hypothetical protein